MFKKKVISIHRKMSRRIHTQLNGNALLGFLIYFLVFSNFFYNKHYFHSEKIDLWVLNLGLKHSSLGPGSRVFKNWNDICFSTPGRQLCCWIYSLCSSRIRARVSMKNSTNPPFAPWTVVRNIYIHIYTYIIIPQETCILKV